MLPLPALGPPDWAAAEDAVLEQRERFSTGPYGRRSAARQRTGRLGERALAAYLEQHTSVERLFDDPRKYGAADVLIARRGVEIKTFRQSSWAMYGPTISAHQLDKVLLQTHAIAFVVVEDGPHPTDAWFVGWVRSSDLTGVALPFISDDFRAELRIPVEALDKPTLMRLLIEAGDTSTVPERNGSRCLLCNQTNPYGLCWLCAPRPDLIPGPVMVTSRAHGRWHDASPAAAANAHPRGREWQQVQFLDVVARRRPCWHCLDAR